MRLMRFAYVIAVGLVLAGLVHIGTLLGVPRIATAGAYERLARLDADGRFAVLPDDGEKADLLPFRDPAFVTAACRFDVTSGPITVDTALPSTYAAVAIHNDTGQPFYALTDKAATNGRVLIRVFGPDDVTAAETEEAADDRPELRIVSPTEAGFILVRFFAAGESAREPLRELASKATCARNEPKVSS